MNVEKLVQMEDEEPVTKATIKEGSKQAETGEGKGSEVLKPVDWNVDEVYNWALSIKNLLEEDAQKLKVNRVTGESLLTLTETKLVNHPYNIAGGPAASLALAIEKLKSPSEKKRLYSEYSDNQPFQKITKISKMESALDIMNTKEWKQYIQDPTKFWQILPVNWVSHYSFVSTYF